MIYKANEDICCPMCKVELGPVEDYASDEKDVPNISDCDDCNEPFEVIAYTDGTFNVTWA